MFALALLFVVPFTALLLNQTLAWRVWRAYDNAKAPIILFAAPWIGLIWTFLSGVIVTKLPFGSAVYVSVACFLYAVVLFTLVKLLAFKPLRPHTVLALVFTIPAIVPVLAPSALVFEPDSVLLQSR